MTPVRLSRSAAFLAVVIATPATAQLSADDLAFRVDRLEAQVRSMSGQIEELSFRLNQLIQALQAGVDPGALDPALLEPLPGAGVLPEASQPTVIDQAESAVGDLPAGSGTSPQILGQVPADPGAAASGAPLDLSQVLRGDGSVVTDVPAPPGTEAPAAAIGPATTGDPQADYERSYQQLVNGDYQLAEAGFRAFLVAYPGNALAEDARFWIGESLYSRGEYREAAQAFLDAYNAAPRGLKAPETLLRLGMALSVLGQPTTACATYAQVLREYPDISAALRQRVVAEQANAACS